MNIFSSPSSYPIGLDISDRSLKLVQLNKKRQSIILQTLSKWHLPPGFIQDGIIKNKEGVIESIYKLINHTIIGKVTNKKVVACLPEPKTFIKLVKIESTNGDFKDDLIHEIEKNVPYSIDEINYDWQVIEKKQGVQKVLISAIEKNIAEQYHEVLKSAGLIPIALEVEAVSIIRSLLPASANKHPTILIVDIGAQRSSCIAYSSNTILFTMSLPISGNKTTDIIAKKLKLTTEKAEIAKVISGLNPLNVNGVIAEALEQKIHNLTSKLNNVIKYLAKHYPEYGEVSDIYLCGGGAQINGLADILTKKLKTPTKIGNVFININIHPRVEEKHLHEEFATLKKIAKEHKIKQNFSLRFATAVGLALRGIYH